MAEAARQVERSARRLRHQHGLPGEQDPQGAPVARSWAISPAPGRSSPRSGGDRDPLTVNRLGLDTARNYPSRPDLRGEERRASPSTPAPRGSVRRGAGRLAAIGRLKGRWESGDRQRRHPYPPTRPRCSGRLAATGDDRAGGDEEPVALPPDRRPGGRESPCRPSPTGARLPSAICGRWPSEPSKFALHKLRKFTGWYTTGCRADGACASSSVAPGRPALLAAVGVLRLARRGRRMARRRRSARSITGSGRCRARLPLDRGLLRRQRLRR